MGKLETGNIGLGNTSTLATLNKDRFLIIDDKELYVIGASLKDLGKKCFRLRRVATADGSRSRSWTRVKSEGSKKLRL